MGDVIDLRAHVLAKEAKEARDQTLAERAREAYGLVAIEQMAEKVARGRVNEARAQVLGTLEALARHVGVTAEELEETYTSAVDAVMDALDAVRVEKVSDGDPLQERVSGGPEK